MDERSLQRIMRDEGIDLLAADGLNEIALFFERALKIAIRPRNISDRTAFRNITRWLIDGCKSGKFEQNTIFRRVLDFALEASGPKSRNPAAVFMSLLKKELGYLKDDRF